MNMQTHHRQRISQQYTDGDNTIDKVWAGVCEYITKNGEQYKHTYLTGPMGVFAIHIIKPDGTEEINYIHTDHLGSWNTITDENGLMLQEQSFDAWGNRRDPDTWRAFTSTPEDPLFDRGFTGHEHLYAFNLINMNGRFYDPIIGRMLSPDNFMQAPDYTQSFNRYSYCWNNPLIYTDPSGEFVLLALWAITTESGYEVQKYISPVAVHINFHLGSEQKGIGADISVGIPKLFQASYRVHSGATYYWGHYDGSFTGWETRNGGEWTLGGVINYSGTTFNSGETSQTTNMITIGGPFINLKYENDNMFDLLQLPGVPNADGGDRYRTSAVRLKYGPFTLGINLFTGDPGLDDRNINPTKGGKYGLYEKTINGDDPDKYRAGVVYVGFGPFKFGSNTEGNRNFIQNELIHDKVSKSPYFRRLDGLPHDDPYYKPNKWYWYFGTGTGNTLW